MVGVNARLTARRSNRQLGSASITKRLTASPLDKFFLLGVLLLSSRERFGYTRAGSPCRCPLLSTLRIHMRFAVLSSVWLLSWVALPSRSASVTPQVKIILQFEGANSAVAVRAMEDNVIRTLRNTVAVRFSNPASALTASAGRLVVFDMRGSCTMSGDEGSAPARGETLASTFVTDGAILPFGEIRCDRIRAPWRRNSARRIRNCININSAWH